MGLSRGIFLHFSREPHASSPPTPPPHATRVCVLSPFFTHTDALNAQIRHGEFQFKVVRLGAQEIVANTADLLVKGELLYIATDEPDKQGFFAPLREAGYELRFLDDYFHAANLTGLESNMLGMVDTLVAAQGRHFVGTWFSTFSGYIVRLRGYARHHRHAGVVSDVGDDSFYFFLKKKFAMRSREAPSDPFYTREWPTAWEDID
jgi:hypothetical protein